METGTGKTYVYVKSIFELNKNTVGLCLLLLRQALLFVNV
ncbi:MAG: hypothetical protein LBE09_06135 [Christensenellaceae bacterium]|nr:hypothetical protein [Christensenellaceae bacterium]